MLKRTSLLALCAAIASIFFAYFYSPLAIDSEATLLNLKQLIFTPSAELSPEATNSMSALRSVSRNVVKKVFAQEQEEVRHL
jgi:hypothetical protein